ncbi:MAG: TonB family protein [Terriglobales bacterium]
MSAALQLRGGLCGTARRLAVGLGLFSLLTAAQQAPAAPSPAPGALPQWTTIRLPHRPRGITAVGDLLWVCGEHGLLARSSDHGVTWETLPAGRFAPRYDTITFSDAQHGIVLGPSGSAATANGGVTWQPLAAAPARSRAAVFPDALHGIADGINSFWVTADGGRSWVSRVLPNKTPSGPRRLVQNVAALDARHMLVLYQDIPGWAEKKSLSTVTELSASADGGKTWLVGTIPGIHLDSVDAQDGRYRATGRMTVGGGAQAQALLLDSGDGLNWVRQQNPLEWTKCGTSGCLYQDDLWTARLPSATGGGFPQSPIIGSRWAASGGTLCAVTETLRCVQLISRALPSTAITPIRQAEVAFTPPRPRSTPDPSYPREAVSAAVEGPVNIGALITETGNVEALVLTDEADPDLALAALKTVRSWRFHPALRAGKPVAVPSGIEINFRLH